MFNKYEDRSFRAHVVFRGEKENPDECDFCEKVVKPEDGIAVVAWGIQELRYCCWGCHDMDIINLPSIRVLERTGGRYILELLDIPHNGK